MCKNIWKEKNAANSEHKVKKAKTHHTSAEFKDVRRIKDESKEIIICFVFQMRELFLAWNEAKLFFSSSSFILTFKIVTKKDVFFLSLILHIYFSFLLESLKEAYEIAFIFHAL